MEKAVKSRASVKEPVFKNQVSKEVHRSKEEARACKKTKDAAAWMHKQSAYKLSAFEKMKIIEEGISKTLLEELKEKARLDYDQLASILNVARATLISKKGSERFNKDLSDKILGLADIYSYGYEVFEDNDRFNSWIFRPTKSLGGQAPFDILNNSFGREEVKNLIGRIDYGVYS